MIEVRVCDRKRRHSLAPPYGTRGLERPARRERHLTTKGSHAMRYLAARTATGVGLWSSRLP
jgi:hypothetical protein